MPLRNVLAVLSAVAAASAAGLVLHERHAAVPSGFTSQGAAPANQVLTIRVGLTANNLAGLEAKLASVSTPRSSEFRQWLSKDEIKSFMEPSSETVSAFTAFASTNNLNASSISPNNDWWQINLPVSQANELFDAQFETFTHADLSSALTRTLSCSLPSELVGHIHVLHPTVSFAGSDASLVPSFRGRSRSRHQDASCDTSVVGGAITPECLQALYGIPATPATQANNSLLVTGYSYNWAQPDDLETFLTLERPDISSNNTFTVVSLDGGVNEPGSVFAEIEANLDTQYTIGIATDVPTEFLTVGGFDFATALLDTTIYLDGVDNPPTVMTTSYGLNENTYGLTLATAICNGFMALGARGISVVFASGDGGVRGGQDDSSICDNNTFIPVFPASCPYVTAVGSTIGIAPEQAVNFTGGGFSNYFPTPSWQSSAVSTFLNTGIPAGFNGTFNATGRGYPDVAVQGWNFEIVAGGEWMLQSGTSASSPTFAAIIALINDQLLAAGKPSLGYLNPFIYSTPTAFNDITEGHNSGYVCPASSVAFDAVVGWDPLAGSGTPIYDKLLAAALA
ncbi:family S53 protease-like protein [Mycena galopus ATCC 62051]|nr:family S53 protease-like protein [Mycena galopus ATCC 62051]